MDGQWPARRFEVDRTVNAGVVVSPRGGLRRPRQHHRRGHFPRIWLRLYKPGIMMRGMNVFEAVAEPTRRGVLDLLAGRERSAGELVAAFPALTQPAVSRHLRILRESQLVDVHADGTRRVYSLRPAALAELDRWLDSYRRFWGERLDDLEGTPRFEDKRERAEGAK